MSRDIRMALIDQNNGDILTFTIQVEKGNIDNLGKSSELKFSIDDGEIFKYSSVIKSE